MTSSCSTFGTQPGDTGNQITAANIAYDNTVTGGDCAHVQCYLEYIGTAYEPLVGIIDAHIADQANPHQVFLDQVMDVSAGSPLNGEVLTFNDSNNTFEMVAPVTGVTDHLLLTNIGVNDHAAIDAHIDSTNNPHSVAIVDIPHNIEDHLDVSILNAAIGETLEWVGSGWENKPPPPAGYKNVIINGRLGAVTDPWIINQRGFDGNWAVLPQNNSVYGYDRWFKGLPDQIGQRVEGVNVIPGATYTLSWIGGGDADIIGVEGGGNAFGPSPLTFNAISDAFFAVYITVPGYLVTNIQLELGTVPTAFEIRPVGLELSLCQRYGNMIFTGEGAAGARIRICMGQLLSDSIAQGIINFPEMRAPPTVDIEGDFEVTSASGASIPATSFSASNIGTTGLLFRLDGTGFGNSGSATQMTKDVADGARIFLDAEII